MAAFVGVTIVAVLVLVSVSQLTGGETSVATDAWYALIGSVALSPIAMVAGGACATILRGSRMNKRMFTRFVATGASLTVAVGSLGFIPLAVEGAWIRSAITRGVVAIVGALGAVASLGVYQAVRSQRVWQLVVARLAVSDSAATL